MRARGRVYGVLLGAVFVAACTGSGTAVKPQTTPSPAHRSPRPIDQVPPAEAQPWRDLGATIVPPDGFLKDVRVPSSTTVLNHTGGKVDDATARKWAEAMVRTTAWEAWGIANLQPDFFTPALGPNGARSDAFAEDERLVRSGLDARGSLAVTPERGIHVNQMTLVAVPQSVQDQIPSAGAVPAGFAWVERQVGPADVALHKPDGTVQSLFHLGPNDQITGITGGNFQDANLSLGPTWYWDFQFECTVDFLRSTCAS